MMLMVCYAEVHFQINPFRGPFEFAPVDGGAVREFHQSMSGYMPTPLWVSPELARAAGVQGVIVKDESARFGLNSFKILGASWAMSRLDDGSSRPSGVAAATAGNHGRAVAWMARQLNIKATIFVPAGTVLRRLQNIRKEGAEVRIVDGNYDDAVRQCAAESQKHGWQVISDTGYPGYLEIPRRVVEGYGTLFAEYEEHRAAKGMAAPDIVMVQAGVGSLLSAAVHHFRPKGPHPILVSVEPEAACCLLESISSPRGQPTKGTGAQTSVMAGLNSGEVSLAAWPSIRCGVDLFLAIEDRYAVEAVNLLGQAHIAAGESGGAGLAGLLALCRDPRFGEAKSLLGLGPSSRVMVINTEGPVGAPRMARG